MKIRICKWHLPMLLMIFSIVLIQGYQDQSRSIKYVNYAATGSNNGSSWSNAYISLQSALNAAVSGDQIWVAKGTYKPSYNYGVGTTDRYNHFRMIEGVAIYGGFSGSETNLNQRVMFREGQTNETILSGDIGSIGDVSDNCYNIFYHPTGLGLTSSAILDGFTLRDANATFSLYGYYDPQNSGSAMYNINNSPTLSNLTITNNQAMFNGVLFWENGSAIISNSVIKNNHSNNGGGFYSWMTNMIMTNCFVINNSANMSGGGGRHVTNGTGSVFINCTFAKNSAQMGGALDLYSSITNYVTMKNCIVWGNTAESGARQISSSMITVNMNYSCYSNSPGDNSNENGTNNIAPSNSIVTDPQFTDAGNNDFRLYRSSGCVNSGNNAFNSTVYDSRGLPRVQNTNIDMGAYEWTAGTDPNYRRLYVDCQATGANDGYNWANAYTNLQDALDAVMAPTEIHVAKGTYKPTSSHGMGGSRYNHFRFKNNVTIYGGFEPLSGGRFNFGYGEENETILSGDIGVVGNASDNCYHVIYNPGTAGVTQTISLDGFTIRDGKANYSTTNTVMENFGGGLFIQSANLTLSNLNFTGNYAVFGGGLNNSSSNITMNNCNFFGNSSTTGGALRNSNTGAISLNQGNFYNNTGTNGGAFEATGSGTIGFTNCSFYSNSGTTGGAVKYNGTGSMTYSNCLIYGNSAPNGGAIEYTGNGSMGFTNCYIYNNTGTTGGAVKYNGTGTMNYTNCLIYGNSATNGGALWNMGTGTHTFTNCTIAGNTAGTNGGGMYNKSIVAVMNNSIIWGNTATVGKQLYLTTGVQLTLNYSCYGNSASDVYISTSSLTATNHNTTSDPLFYSFSPLYRLIGNSPCVNTGNNAYNSLSTDIRGKARIQNSIIDMGAYEWTYLTDPSSLIVYVKHNATGSNNGSSWQNAFTSLQTALQEAMPGMQIWVAKGTYYPSLNYQYIVPWEPRDKCFRMISGVEIYGGFSGTESSLSQRTSFGLGQTNETILSGDIGVTGDLTDNCFHVINNTFSDIDSTAVLDGFTVRDGNADTQGGGLFNWGSTSTIRNITFIANANYAAHTNEASLKAINCIFIQNDGGISAYYGGKLNIDGCSFINNTDSGIEKHSGDLFLYNSTFTGNNGITAGGVSTSGVNVNVDQCTFTSNSAIQGGGGLYLVESTANVKNCTLISNSAPSDLFYYGGAISLFMCQSPVVSNCVISNNSSNGGGGGLVALSCEGVTKVNNCSFSSNSASTGSEVGAYSIDDDVYTNMELNNCIIWGEGSSQIYASYSTLSINHTCYNSTALGGWNSTIYDSNDNISSDPCFANAVNNDLRLYNYSPCINEGDNVYNTLSEDIRGEARVQSSIIDMGAYEYTDLLDPVGTTVYVKYNATGSNNGTSWQNAYTSLQTALNAATTGTQIWVSKGTYKPSSDYGIGGGSRAYHFRLKNGVGIYGGFAGTESSLNARTNHGSGGINETIFSGDLGVSGSSSDNCYHVFYHPATALLNSSAVLDGVTICNGNANYNTSNTNHLNFGGGMYNNASSPYLRNVIFSNNYGRYGGGLSNQSNASPLISNCLFYQNSAYTGGAIQNTASASPTFINTTIASNTASSSGGGINNNTDCSTVFYNSIIWGNSAPTGNQFSLNGGTTTSADLSYCCYANGTNDVYIGAGSFNVASLSTITSNPKFINAATMDFRVYGNSPVVNAGSNLQSAEIYDILGRARIQNTRVDMGAYEWTAGTDPALDPALVTLSNGAAFVSPASNALTDAPVGRFALNTDGRNCTLTDVSISLTGDYTQLSNFKLYESNDNSFDSEVDIVISGGATRNANSEKRTRTDRALLTFTSLNRPLTSVQKYYFVTCDVAGNASGSLFATLANQNSITFNGGIISPTFTNAPLSSGTISFHPPVLTLSQNTLPSFGSVLINSDSSLQSYTVSGINLLSDVTISAPPGFTLSTGSRSTMIRENNRIREDLSQVVLTPINGVLASTILNVVFHPVSEGVYSGNITHNTLYASSSNVAVTGTGIIVSPQVITNSVNNITFNSAICEGNVVTGNGYPVTSRGFVWSNTANPTLESHTGLVTNGTGTGTFTSTLSGLLSSRTYYVRAFASNVATTAYGTEFQFTTLSRTVFVDCSKADNSGDGNSWLNAKKSLQIALQEPLVAGDQIWVAKGTYYPNSTWDLPNEDSRNAHFRLLNGVKIFGGFYGTENSVDQRSSFGQTEANETILSGDIGLIGNNTDNCYHIIYNPDHSITLPATELNGFTISNGKDEVSGGAGMCLYSATLHLENLIFYSNSANGEAGGGGLYCNQGTLSLKSVKFINNTSLYNGGGASLTSSSATMSEVEFVSNSAYSCGGLNLEFGNTTYISDAIFTSNHSENTDAGAIGTNNNDLVLTNCLIANNTCNRYGAGLFFNSTEETQTILTNVTITGNTSSNKGGGITFSSDNSSSSLDMNNCILWGNTSLIEGNEIYISNSGVSTMNYSCYGNEPGDLSIEPGTLITSNNNITANPMFRESEISDYSLLGISPAVNSGLNAYNTFPSDLRGFARIQNTTIDMGAYEWTEGTDLPYLAQITFQNGGVYTPQVTNGFTNQSLGRFSLQTDGFSAGFNSLVIKLTGDFSGKSNYRLWESSDDSYNPESDQMILTTGVIRESSLPATRSVLNKRKEATRDLTAYLDFIGLDRTITNVGKYYFLTCDVASSATGSLMAVIENNAGFTFTNGIINETILNAPLVSAPIVFIPPVITVPELCLLNFGEVPLNNSSEPQSYIVSATGLQSDLVIAAPGGFLISLNEFAPEFTSEIVLSPINGIVDSTRIYVIFKPESAFTYAGYITHHSQNVDYMAIVSLGGTGTTELTAPQNLTISLMYGTLIMDWDDVPNAISYKIFSSDSPNGEYTFVESVNTSFWLHWIEGNRKFFRVKASTN